VNGEEFSSNKTQVDFQKEYASFGVYDLENDLHMSFDFPYLPLSGYFLITNSGLSNSSYVHMGVHYNGNFYNVKNDLANFVTAENNGGKSKIIMDPTWFKGYFEPNDSVLVSCEFNEP